MAETRAGFVALVGEPNVGKSTLLNCMVGSRISVVTHKAQTTRFRIRGIAIEGEAQIVFVDTPGLFDPRSRLDRAMVGAAWKSTTEADIVLLMTDARTASSDTSLSIVDAISERMHPGRKLAVALNKIDRASPEELLTSARILGDRADFAAVFMISATRKDGVGDVLTWLAGEVPRGPWLFPEDQVSDLPVRVIAAEITRGRLMLRLHEEIPYRLSVESEGWTERKDGSVRIDQVVHVAREGHRGIIVGRQGRVIRQVSAEARREISEFLGREVHLFLRVKVRPGWEDDVSRYIASETSG